MDRRKIFENFLCNVGKEFTQDKGSAGGILRDEKGRGIRFAERSAPGAQGGNVLLSGHGRAGGEYVVPGGARSTAN